jgi:ketosteroid isomerase-like protein
MSVEDEVLAANAAFYAAFNGKDVEAMDALWARSVPVACTHPNWNALTNRVDVMASWESILANPRQPKLVAGAAEAIVIGDVAVVICRELVAGSPLAATNVFTLEDGGWRMVHHHASPVALLGNA